MFNPAKSSRNIKNEYISYVATSFPFADQNLKRKFREELEKNTAKGPYLEIKDIFTTGASIDTLIEENILSPLFRDLESKKNDKVPPRLPITRPLYKHQENAIRKIEKGENVIISTGTGSGKTNCFLIPVIDSLLKEKEQGTLSPGVRAMFIYPMNALANDQIKNLRSILMKYEDITFGVYNGATLQKEQEAIDNYEAMFCNESIPELRKRLPNEVISREEMKRTPPHILFTNYAMLEHLLFRPKDDVLFSNADFRFVVLDEAHVYTGATGIETAMLIRRLKARISHKKETQFILTSATLGSDESSNEEIIKFAENLCDGNFSKENIIRAEREEFNSAKDFIEYPLSLYRELDEDTAIVSNVLEKYGINFDKTKTKEELIYEVISSSSLYKTLREKARNIQTINEIEEILNIDDEDTTIAFISLCTKAREKGKSLIDARYHFFIRSLEGCFITLEKDPQIFLTRKKVVNDGETDFQVFEIAICENCGDIAIVGTIENKRKFVQKTNNEGNDKCSYFIFNKDESNIWEEEEDENTKNLKLKKYKLCPHCGTISLADRNKEKICDCAEKDYIEIIEIPSDKDKVKCGKCNTGDYKRFYLGNDAATSVLATALFEELPEYKVVTEIDDQEDIKSNIFKRSMNKTKEEKLTRQFLCFSDSRQEAAKFACYLTSYYEEFLRRRGITHIIAEEKDEILKRQEEGGYTISDLITRLSNFFSSKHTFQEKNPASKTESNKNAWIAVLNELVRYSSSATSLTNLGFLQFSYLGNTQELIHNISQEYKIPEINAKSLLDALAFEIIRFGAILTDKDSDIDDSDREYIFHTKTQQYITLEPNDKGINVWMPKSKKNSSEEYYRTKRILYIKRTLKISEEKAMNFLKEYYGYLKDYNNNDYAMIDQNKNGTYAMPSANFCVRIDGCHNTKWYRCKKCGKITQFNLDDKCILTKCNGDIEIIDPLQLQKDNHFASLYTSDNFSPLIIKEHTAQLSKKESLDYQEQFIRKEINALSCSTTFEMGVDVGDLETVFLRDVPPLPANYAQRAGRAGRSIHAAAYALTFARLSSHDLEFFKHPESMISGQIKPPIFKLDNEKIVKRHMYAIALSLFFSIPEYIEMYNNNDAEKFINEKGYKDFVNWLNSKPNELKKLLKESIPDVDDLHLRLGLEDFSWLEDFVGEKGIFTLLIREYENNVAEFDEIIEKTSKTDKYLSIITYKRKKYTDNQLIDFLARGNILPRYGFPVDTVELSEYNRPGIESELRMTRDLQMAIADYAPSSEVVANGHLYTSRYIKKSAKGNSEDIKNDWNTAYIGKCKNEKCGTINFSITPISKEGIKCIACNETIPQNSFTESIEPREGFIAEVNPKIVKMGKQERNFKSMDYYIGNKEAKLVEKYKYTFNGNNIHVESTSNDSLLVISEQYFYVCSYCGFARGQHESFGDDKVQKDMIIGYSKITTKNNHPNTMGKKCNNKTLEKRRLHHIFNTDVAKITFDCDTSNQDQMLSVMYAILFATSSVLNIEQRDLKACLSLKILNGKKNYSIIIYDSVPGGAGYSRRLILERTLRDIFDEAYNRMNECNCDPSCYNCLRSYENQRIHEKLNRQLALDFLSKFKED